MTSKPEIRSFEDFWPHYVAAHKHPGCRVLHYVGTSLALGCASQALFTGNLAWLLAAPVVGYGFAWAGHFLVEGNRPATLQHPLYSLRGDVHMLRLGLTGKMAQEVQRLTAAREAEPAAPSEQAA